MENSTTKLPDLAKPIGTTLDRFIKKDQDHFPYATGELSQLLRDIDLAAKILYREISRSGLGNLEGTFGSENVQGEVQQKLDVVAHIRFVRALTNGGQVCGILSEEVEDIIQVNPDARYVVAMDPLDGSSNIDVNVSIGTIFSIYRRLSPVGQPAEGRDFLQKGREQVAAGYVLYGSSTLLVYSTGRGVHGFTYEPSLGEFFLSHPDIVSPDKGTIFSVNSGNWAEFDRSIQDFMEECKQRKMTGRYIGSLVADIHRNMIKGGIYFYPGTKKHPTGKLRLLYEANAMAFLAEDSNGLATDGKQNILDIQPTSFHQRTPLIIGVKATVEEYLESKKKYPDEK